MNREPTVIITGASGFIGRSLVRHFADMNWTVKALQRKPEMSERANIRFYGYSLPDHVDQTVFEGTDYLIHCAVQQFSARQKNADELNVLGARAVLDLCRRHAIKVIFLSSLSAHAEAESHYGRNKLLLESLFDRQKDLVLKLGLVLGHGGLFGRIREGVEKGGFVPLVGGEQPMQTLAMDDLCRVIDAAIEKNIAGNYAVAEPQSFPMREMYRSIAAKLSKRTRFIPVPMGIVYAACRIAESLNIQLPVSSESVLGLKHLKSFETRGSLEEFGVRVKSFQESLEKLL